MTEPPGERPLPDTVAQRLRHRRQRRFLRGPIPWPWLEAASRLPGKALQVALALRYRAGFERTNTVTLPSGLLAAMGIDRFAKARALAALEEAGLVEVRRRPGRSPVVTILEVEQPGERSGD